MKYCPCNEWRDNIDSFSVSPWLEVPSPIYCQWCGSKLIVLEGINKPVDQLTEKDLERV